MAIETDLPDLNRPHGHLYTAFLAYYLAGYFIEVGEAVDARLRYERTHTYWLPTAEPEETIWMIDTYWTLNRALPWDGWRVWKLPTDPRAGD